MPRIAILHPDLGLGGAERLIIDIGLALKASGYEVDMYTNFHDKNRCFDETRNGQLNVFVACSWFPRNIFGKFNALCAYMRFILLAIYVVFLRSTTISYDLFLCDQISACIPILKMSQKPVLFYCHYPDHLLTKRESILKKIYRYPIDSFENWTTCLADRILVNSKFTKSVFEQHISSKIPVEILYPTIPNQPPSKSNENEKSINFLSINRFERKKNLSLAIEAFARLHQSLENSSLKPIHLYMIGGYDPRLNENVEYFNELNQLATKFNLDSNSITFVRSFSDEEKREYLSRSHCILYTPSFEHFGIVPLEGMQASRPVIATATGGPLETIVDGKTGYLCDEPLEDNFARRMREFVENENLSREMGQQGKQHVQEKFSFEPFRKQLSKHIEELLNKPVKNNSYLMIFVLSVLIFVFSFLFIFWRFF